MHYEALCCGSLFKHIIRTFAVLLATNLASLCLARKLARLHPRGGLPNTMCETWSSVASARMPSAHSVGIRPYARIFVCELTERVYCSSKAR